MPKPAIKLMPDYHCWPLWHHAGKIGNIDPSELGISKGLRQSVENWSAIYDSHLNLNEPNTITWTETEERLFDSEGRKLALLLASELNDRFDIYYSSRCIPVNELFSE